MKTLHLTEAQAVSGGHAYNITINELRNGVRIAAPIAGSVCGLLIANIFDRTDPIACAISASIGAIALYFATEMSIGDKVWYKNKTI